MDIDDVGSIRANIDVLEKESTIPKRSRSTNLGPYVEEINEYGYQFGHKAPELERILKVISSKNELDQTTITTLIKNLYPSERLPSTAVLVALGGLGQGSGKPSFATQSNALRWIRNIQHVLLEPEYLLRFYGLLFGLLDILALRPTLCQLLILVTRRRHVKPFRIQKLLSLCQQYGNDTALVNLLKVYKNFYPEIVISWATSNRSNASFQQDAEWRTRLLSIQNAASYGEPNTISVVGGFTLARNNTKKKRATIPEVHTYHATEAAVTLEDIDSTQKFVDTLERIEPPSQLIAGLGDPLVQKYLQLNKSADAVRRLEFWLERSFEEEMNLLMEGFGVSPTLGEMFSALLSYTEYTKELHPVAERFFMSYLPLWDGNSYMGLILDLLTYLKPTRLQDIENTILLPLETAVLYGALSPYVTLFDFYSKLVPRWITIIASTSPRSSNNLQEVRAGLKSLDLRVSTIALSALSTHESTASPILIYYTSTTNALSSALSRASDASKPLTLPIISLPPPEIFYLLLFTPNAHTLSSLCTLLTTLKLLLERLIRQNTPIPESLPRSLNAYLMDTCNLLWRSRAFVSADQNAQACLLPDSSIGALREYVDGVDREANLAGLFGVPWHPSLSSLAHAAFVELEEANASAGAERGPMHEGPVSQRSLVVLANEGGVDVSWREYRVKVLEWCEERGLGGIKSLILAVVKNALG